jgi:hypothetical protein
MIHPVTNIPEPKSRFVPSRWEIKRVCSVILVLGNILVSCSWKQPRADQLPGLGDQEGLDQAGQGTEEEDKAVLYAVGRQCGAEEARHGADPRA